MELTTCPECGAPAQIEQRHVLESTDGPVEHVRIRCVSRHWFFLTVAALEVTPPCAPPRAAAPGSRSRPAPTRR
jgi:hypothetical protein